MALIFILSAQPKLPPLPGLGCLEQTNWFDKVKHAAAYAVLGALLWRALAGVYRKWIVAALVVGISVLYGVTDEYHQKFVPNRTCDICDLIADTAGAALAVVIVGKMMSRRKSCLDSKGNSDS